MQKNLLYYRNGGMSLLAGMPQTMASLRRFTLILSWCGTLM